MNYSNLDKYMKAISLTVLGAVFMSCSAMASPELPEGHCPVLREDQSFTYQGQNSRQVVWASLPFMDREFLEQTGAPNENEKMKRAVSSVELLLLIRLVLKGGHLAHDQNNLLIQAQDEMGKELRQRHIAAPRYLGEGIIPIDDLVRILDGVRNDIAKFEHQGKGSCIIG